MFKMRRCGVAVSLVLIGLLVACGDDTTSATRTVQATTPRNATVTSVASASPSPANGTGSATASAVAGVGTSDYSTYVSKVCSAAKRFKDDLANAADSVKNDPQRG